MITNKKLFSTFVETKSREMSFQTFVTERLADITEKYNALVINAKKIIELPIQSTLDPASKIHVSRGGTSESLEVQKIIDAITEKNYSQLLAIGEITVSGLNVIVPSAAMWVYEGVVYQTIAITTIPETLCAAGFLRKDILVANQSNQIVLIKGVESETIRIKPNTPPGTVFVSEIDVDDAVIGTPSTPIVGDNFISKVSQSPRRSYDDVIIDLENETRIILYTCTEINYINHLIPGQAYDGRQLFLTNENEDESDIVINNLFNHKGNFSFSNALPFTLKFKETIQFKLFYDFGNKVTYLYVGTIISDFENTVYFNDIDPNTATYFSLSNPPVTNDNALKLNTNNLYSGTDASTWVYDLATSVYIPKIITSDSSNFWVDGTSNDAGKDKTVAISRSGPVGVGAAVSPNHAMQKSQVDDLLGLKVDKVTGKGLSTEDYTTSEKNKLASIDATHYLPPLQTTVQLSALPQAGISDKARVYVETDLSDYFYDATASSGDVAPDDQVGGIGFWRIVAVGGETAASIKTKYESNADTNAFTNALKAKLDSITEIFTTALKTGYDGVVTGYNALMATGSRLITSGEITKLSNTSGTNSGDQDLSGLSLKPIQVTAQTLTAGSWTLISGYYEYNLANANITATSIVDVIPDNAYVPIVQVAQVLPKTLSGSGTVKLYSTNLPTGNIIVTLNIWK